MYVIRFSSMKVVEHPNIRAFEQRVGRWLLMREGENSYLLGEIPRIAARANSPQTPFRERLFTIEDGDQIAAAAVLLHGGCLCMTWATDEIVETLADHLGKNNCNVLSTFAPGHVSWRFASRWAELTGQSFGFGRSERVYQLARLAFDPPATGRLDLITDRDIPLVRTWLKHFSAETDFEMADGGHEEMLQVFLREQVLYLWRNPHPVAMAAWVAPTPNGGAINCVYVPPELRRQGHAKAVVTALAARQLAAGKKYCFIMTDTQDLRTNQLYQSIGARTLCELLRCTIRPKPALTNNRPAGNLNIVSAIG